MVSLDADSARRTGDHGHRGPGTGPQVRWTAGLLAVGIAVLGGLGVTNEIIPEGGFGDFGLDREGRPAAAFSGGVLLVGSTAFALLSVRTRGSVRRSHAVMASLLALMCVDEMAKLHERLEEATGVDWQVLYLPVAILGLIAWGSLLHAWGWRTVEGMLLLGGGACWGVSQVLEKVQWDGEVRQPGYTPMMITEELLEMAGSGMFVLAALTVLTRATVPGPGR